MRVVATALPDVLLVEPDVHRDARGFFLETWHAHRYADSGIDVPFVQDNHSRSARGTLRGLHAQLAPHAQAKLVRAVAGEVWDVAVDIRRGSPTFGRHAGATLSAENFHQLFIPAGFAHGFCVLSETAEIEYKCSAFYVPEAEIAIAWNDPELAIPWPVKEPLVSGRDGRALRLAELTERLPHFEGAGQGS